MQPQDFVEGLLSHFRIHTSPMLSAFLVEDARLIITLH